MIAKESLKVETNFLLASQSAPSRSVGTELADLRSQATEIDNQRFVILMLRNVILVRCESLAGRIDMGEPHGGQHAANLRESCGSTTLSP